MPEINTMGLVAGIPLTAKVSLVEPPTRPSRSGNLVGNNFEGVQVQVLPAGERELPMELMGAPHYRVEAINVDIVYNRFGGHDPAGMLYVLEEDREAVQAGSTQFNGNHDPLFFGEGHQGDLFTTDPATGAQVKVLTAQPLVLRANRGETIVIDFTNRLLPHANQDGDDPDDATNIQVRGALLDASALPDPKAAVPRPADVNPPGPGGYHVRYVVRVGSAAPTEGTYLFHSKPVVPNDVSRGLKWTREQVAHGLFGALIVEPPGSHYYDPSACQLAGPGDGRGNYEVDMSSYKEIRSGWGAIITDGPITAAPDRNIHSFREYVLMFHDDLQGKLAKIVESQPRAISYRTEPFSDLFDGRDDAGVRPFAINDKSMAYSAYAYGDSSTPHPRFYVGDPMRYRVVHAGMGEQFHVFHHHGHRWRFQTGVEQPGVPDGRPNLTSPSKWGIPQFAGQPDATTTSSTRVDSQALGPGETFDVLMEGGAGGVQRTVGDALLHCHIIDHVTRGMWTYARIYNTLQQRSPRQPGLAPLPEKLLRVEDRPPMAVDSATLAQLVREGRGPRPASGALADKPIDSVEDKLYPYIESQLPPAGQPDPDKQADPNDLQVTNRANLWDWSTVQLPGRGRLYLGEPYDVSGPGPNHFGIGFPTPGEGVGAKPDGDPAPGAPADRPPLMFNPNDGRLAYPQLLPHAGHRPPFAPRHRLVRPEPGSSTWQLDTDRKRQGAAYLGPVFDTDDPGRKPGPVLGAANGSGLVPIEADADPRHVRHFDIVALELPINHATHGGAPIRGEFGLDKSRLSGTTPEPQTIEILGVGPSQWEVRTRPTSKPQQPPTSLDGDKPVLIRSGDTIEWRVELDEHGLVFKDKTIAETVLQFQDGVGLAREFIEDSQFKPSYSPAPWGTDKAGAGTILARCTVRDIAEESKKPVEFTCRVHGPSSMKLELTFQLDEDPNVDPRGQIFVLRGDVEDIMAGRKRAEPLVLRANTGDAVDITLTSALKDQTNSRQYSKVGIHTHLVQYDLQSSDGAVGGLNYETSIRPTLRWDADQRRLVPIRGADGFGEQVHYRWWCDTELGSVYFHDHSFLKESLPHGLFGVTIVEPNDAEYRDPRTGEELYVREEDGWINRSTGRDGLAVADIVVKRPRGGEAFREFVPLFNDGDKGSMINLRHEPPTERVRRPDGQAEPLRISWQHGQPRLFGGVGTAFSSILFGDPVTPMWIAYDGDPMRIRTEAGGTNELHSLNVHGLRWKYEFSNPGSTLRDFLVQGTSEAFSFVLQPERRLRPGDYLYGSTSERELLRQGKWGLLRILDSRRPDVKGARARGTLHIFIDQPATVTIHRGHEFVSTKGVSYVATETVTYQEHALRANNETARFGGDRPAYFFDVEVEAREAGAEGNAPSETRLATSGLELVSRAGRAKLLAIEAATELRGGRTALLPLAMPAGAAARPLDGAAAHDDAVPEDFDVPPAAEPRPSEQAVNFQVAALEVELPANLARSPTTIPIDASLISIEPAWKSGVDRSATNRRLVLYAREGDILEFRQADIGNARRVIFPSGRRIRKIGQPAESSQILEELPVTGAAGSRLTGQVQSPALPEGYVATEQFDPTGPDQPIPMVRLKVLNEFSDRIEFKDYLPALEGNFTELAGEIRCREPALAYIALRTEEIPLAEALHRKALARDDDLTPEQFNMLEREIDEMIRPLTAALQKRFLARPEPMVLRVAAPKSLGSGTPQPVDVAVRLTNLLPKESSRFGPAWCPATSLHPSLVGYDLPAGDGSAVGRNPHSLVLRGNSRTYVWRVDQELGICYLRDTADTTHPTHGLFGALIVEPPGTKFLPSRHDEPEPAGSQALIIDEDQPGRSFRELVLFTHDGWRDVRPVALNYYSARNIPDAPATPTFRVHAGDPVLVRQVHAAGLGPPDNHSFIVDGSRWPFDYREGRSNRIAAIGEAPAAAFNIRREAEATAQSNGRWYLVGCQVASHLDNGEWCLLHVVPRGAPADNIRPLR